MFKIEIPNREKNIIYKSDNGKRYYLAVCTDEMGVKRRKR